MTDSTALATVDPSDKVIRGIFGGQGLALRTSLAMKSDAEKKKVLRLTQQQGENIGKYIGKRVLITDVIAHPQEFVNKDTGEVTTGVRIILVLKDGKTITCASGGVARSLGMLADVFGPPSWPDGLAVEIEQVTTGRGYRTFQLVVSEK